MADVRQWVLDSHHQLLQDDNENASGAYGFSNAHHRRGFQPLNSDDEDDNEIAELADLYNCTSSSSGSRGSTPSPHPTNKLSNSHPWFLDRSFCYHGYFIALAFPGIWMTLKFGGDMILCVLCAGGVMVYLFSIGDDRKKMFSSFLLTLVCTLLTILYTTIPLLWQSWLNIILVIALFGFTALTGAWLALCFSSFRKDEPELCRVLETTLFCLYPTITTFLVTWMAVNMTYDSVMPYSVLLLGFGLLQIFLKPRCSSFVKRDKVSNDEALIVDTQLTAAVSFSYCASVPGLHCIRHLSQGFQSLFMPATMIEWLFLTCLSILLTTFLHWRPWLEKAGLTMTTLKQWRLWTAVSALTLFTPCLACWGITSPLLSWLPVALLSHGGVAWSVLLRQSKVVTIVTIISVGVIDTLLVLQIPLCVWRISDPGFVSTFGSHGLLIVVAILSAGCLYAVTTCSQDLAGVLVLLHTICCVWLEHYMLIADLLPIYLLAVMSIFMIYVFIRLYHSHRLPQRHVWLSISLHGAGMLVSFSYLSRPTPSLPGYVATVEFLGAWILLATAFQVTLFESSEIITNEKLSRYIGGVIIGGGICLSHLRNAVWLTVSVYPDYPQGAALVVALTALVTLKLSFLHDCMWSYARMLGTLAMFTSCIVIAARPIFTFSWDSMPAWTQLFCFMAGMTMTPVALTQKSKLGHIIVSSLLGVPLGLMVFFVASAGENQQPYNYLYAIAVSICIFIAITLWVQPVGHGRTVIKYTAVLTAVLMISLILDNQPQPDTTTNISLGGLLSAATSLCVAVMLKVYSLWNQSGELSSRGELQYSKLPLLGNTVTACCFLVMCHLCPFNHWEPWVVICSEIWFLLQRDKTLLTRNHKDMTIAPTIITVSATLLVSTICNSACFLSTVRWRVVIGVIELLVVLMIMPVFITTTTALISGLLIISDLLVVFTTPLGSLLFIFGSTYASWILGLWTMCVGGLLMRYRLPLRTNIDVR